MVMDGEGGRAVECIVVGFGDSSLIAWPCNSDFCVVLYHPSCMYSRLYINMP